jgi:GAF domain-containing protein/HAMP domain-containing protein
MNSPDNPQIMAQGSQDEITQTPPVDNIWRGDDTNSSKTLFTIIIITSALFGLVCIPLLLTAATQISSWQLWTLIIIFGSAFVAGLLISPPVYLKHKIKVYLLLLIVHLAFIFWSALVSGISWILGLVAILYTILVVNATLKTSNTDRIVTINIVASILISLAGVLVPFTQLDILWLQLFVYALLAASGIIFAYRSFPVANLRTKITTAVLVIVLLPLIIQSIVQNRFIQGSLSQQNFNSLKLVASQTASKIDDFIRSNQETISKDASLSVFSDYLLLPEAQRVGSQQEKNLLLTIEALRRRPQAFLTSYALLNDQGTVIYDTIPAQIGSSEASQDHFRLPLRSGQIYVSQVQFPSWNADPYIYFTGPVFDSAKKVIGVLRLRYNGKIFQRLLEQNVSLLGLRSYPILMDENFIRLADTVTPNMIFRSLAPLEPTTITTLRRERRLPFFTDEDLSTNMVDLATQLKNYQQNPFFTAEFHIEDSGHIEAGAIVPLQTKPWYLLYIQEQAVLSQLLIEQNRVFILVATLIAGILGVFVSFVSRIVANPILALTATAEKIAVGDLNAQAIVSGQDEIGTLANTFNLMTAQLRNSISSLETRVQDRTKELADQNEFLRYSSQQLQTLADVARSIASVRNLDELLDQVTVFISQRFGFYHVGIFLTDENGYAVLRAANSPGGKRMLARQHKLKVGQVGIVGYVTDRGEPRIATDVGQDAVYFNNPDLPQTRSEMALPLRVGNETIGALDVQSTEANAFSGGDIALFTTLSDQIAIAIDNNRLYAETNRALEEARNLHRQYLRQEWSRATTERQVSSYLYTSQGVSQQEPVISDEIEQVLETGETIAQNGMIVPISLRGETIGVIQIQERGTRDRVWSNDEVIAVQSVADQVGQALENARLFEQTVRRAERERLVIDITSKIRATTDAQQMIEIAIQELQKTLNISRAQIILSRNPTPEEIPSNRPPVEQTIDGEVLEDDPDARRQE